MHEEHDAPDRLVARIAARQHGVVTVRQLAAAGVSKDATSYRLQVGRLHRIHRGIYAVGHPQLGHEGRWIAATLACGEAAVLSHRSAAALWNLLPVAGPVHVTVPDRGGRMERRGIQVHRSRTLHAEPLRFRKGIPVTTPARTIRDLRGTVRPADLRRAIRQAEVLGLDLGPEIEADRTRSELEHSFLWLCRRQRLPMPEPNASIGRLRVDFLWRDAALIVETDGYRFHRGRQAFEDDRARDTGLRLRGYEVVRFTYRQVLEDPALVAGTVRILLARQRERERWIAR